MKNYKYKILEIGLVTLFFLFIPKLVQAEGVPIITSIVPNKIQIGGEIEIRGQNFGATLPSHIDIYDKNRNESQLLYLRGWSDTVIRLSTEGFSSLGEHIICLRWAGGETTCSEGAAFDICSTPNCEEVPLPVITSVSPTTPRIGSTIDIFGENFNNVRSGEAKLGLIKSLGGAGTGEIIYVSNTKITIKFNSDSIPGQGRVRFEYITTRGAIEEAISPYFTVQKACDWECGNYGECTTGGTQTRTCTKPDDCQSLTTPIPQTTQTCTYRRPCTADDYDCTEWGSCSVLYNKQTRQCGKKASECEGGVPPPATTQSCSWCDKDIWSCYGWSDCSSSGSQSRTCTKAFDCPTDNTPSPATTQSCVYTPPCTEDTWSCGDWTICSSYGSQTRVCNKTNDCSNVYTPSPATSQNCTPPCSADTWTCGSWGACSLSGIQSRSCSLTFDCPIVLSAPPVTDQYCEPSNSSLQQVPQSGSDIVSDQGLIIKSTVKLICPVDEYRASQGSGTIIDSSGTILTNKHVIAGTLGCLVGFVDNSYDEPYFGERQIANIVKASTNEDMAILKIRNPKNINLPSIDITKGVGDVSLGTKISTYGYPAKFGTKMTYTSGDFSGTEGNYFKTTAILEHGNSGGGAYLKDGKFIGIPSMVRKGELNSMGYILSINTIKAWLGNTKIVSSGTNNNYSRVSVLEDIDLKKLGSLKLFIPGPNTPIKPPATITENQKKESQTVQSEKESVVIDKNTSSTPEQQPQKISLIKRFFLWLANLFNKLATR